MGGVAGGADQHERHDGELMGDYRARLIEFKQWLSDRDMRLDRLVVSGTIRPHQWLCVHQVWWSQQCADESVGYVLYVADEDKAMATAIWPDVLVAEINTRTMALNDSPCVN